MQILRDLVLRLLYFLAQTFFFYFSMDEFYSHYYYDGDAVDPADGGVDVSQCEHLANWLLRL